MHFYIQSQSSDFDKEISQSANLVGVNRYSRNCIISDADYGYSLMHTDIANWSGFFSIHDYFRRLPKDRHPNFLRISSMECALISRESGEICYLTNHIFDVSTFNEKQFQLDAEVKGILAGKELPPDSAHEYIHYLVIDYANSLGLKIIEKNYPQKIEFQGALILNTKLFLEIILILKNLYGIFCYEKYIKNENKNIDPKFFLNLSFAKILSNFSHVHWVGQK